MSETAARAPSIGVGIIYCLLFENRADVSLTMENANDREHVLAQQIVNAEFVKSLHGPRAKIAKYRIAYRLGGTSLRPRQREFDAQFDRTAETFRDIREPLLRIPFKLPHNVSIRRWQKDELHASLCVPRTFQQSYPSWPSGSSNIPRRSGWDRPMPAPGAIGPPIAHPLRVPVPRATGCGNTR